MYRRGRPPAAAVPNVTGWGAPSPLAQAPKSPGPPAGGGAGLGGWLGSWGNPAPAPPPVPPPPPQAPPAPHRVKPHGMQRQTLFGPASDDGESEEEYEHYEEDDGYRGPSQAGKPGWQVRFSLLA